MISFLVTLFIWGLFTWPLPRHLTTAIPSSEMRGDYTSRAMIPGDHLQLMYHFWLFSDMMRGRTPWFTNVYEFNTGRDEDRFELTYNFIPFSFFFAVGERMAGRAFGWNFSAFLSLWFTLLASWYLARRFTDRDTTALAASLVGILFTYRWHALMGGSPTGFAMMWVPVLFLGLDMAVRESRIGGGVLAGAIIFITNISDTHVFFFIVIFSPVWCLLSFTLRDDFRWLRIRDSISIAAALIPVAVFTGLALLVSKLLARELSESVMVHGRRLGEVAGFSPRPEGLFSLNHIHISSQAYLGIFSVALVFAGWIILIHRVATRETRFIRPLVFMTLTLAVMTALVILALGPHGPWDARLFVLVRELIPPYAMIRQAGKVLCLMPALLTAASAVTLTQLVRLRPSRAWQAACLIVPALIWIGEYKTRVAPTLSYILEEQPAYAAVAEHAAGENQKPHVVVVVLWPGDSHYASVYEHYVSRYRIRMVNGYRPAVPLDYYNNIFLRFVSINQGHFTVDQADALLDMGVRYVLVHQDLFPEQVSPFPATHTLRQFLNHPRLNLLKQGDRVWAFRILETEESRPPILTHWNTAFPARHWEMERSRYHEVDRVEDPNASGGGYLSFSRYDASVLTRHTSMPPADHLRWMIRARGKGQVTARALVHNEIIDEKILDISAPEWAWIEYPLPLENQATINLHLIWKEGDFDIDSALLTAGTWAPPEPRETLDLPAPLFFHSGYTDPAKEHVVIEKMFEPTGRIFYGPGLPLDAGLYDVEFLFDTDAAHGTKLGVFRVEAVRPEDEDVSIPVIAGQPVRATVNREHNLPFTVSFRYDKQDDLIIEAVRIKRTK